LTLAALTLCRQFFFFCFELNLTKARIKACHATHESSRGEK
jgi:hypothetical protein